MKILTMSVQNFRKLLQCRIDVSEKTTIFVGANNSGKPRPWMHLANFSQIVNSRLMI